MVLAYALFSEIMVVILALLVVYIIFKLGKSIIGLIANVILGFISLLLVNSLFGLGIPYDWITLIITALLGLPGVAILIILKLFGLAL